MPGMLDLSSDEKANGNTLATFQLPDIAPQSLRVTCGEALVPPMTASRLSSSTFHALADAFL